MNCTFQILGKKDSGKTLVLEKVISALKERGLVVATVKHTHHIINPENKDTARYMSSGSDVTVLHSNDCALFWGCDDLSYVNYLPADVILIEGFEDINLGKRYLITNPSEAVKIANDIIKEASLCSNEPKLKTFPEHNNKIAKMLLYNLMKKWGLKEVRVIDD
ncbi:molybdopterin-guanine dinucleotide biosynthesis protein B [Metallosphaera tengchongensis]|uniref:Molybdopterin-guanine dinucleotide biosynthesis protein B n=1 Tax=Metallosphaera tengchongensis TaxID=1532350 RepID=A0A6N0NU23_9CREN|nr:molybdopterin-guanine dinucleotide biosynthesis protein B [Metallosphaera tengchongensis]QKQ99654.1 molybdopterin-guanine dinucleotide biosynthesis protein B [Metallosphaera tengchongensis]